MQKLTKEIEKKLVDQARTGSQEAFRKLVEAYQDRLFAVAVGILKSKVEAEEVTQESFVKAYLSLPSFKGDSSFYTWIYRITFHMAIDAKRKLNRQGGDKLQIEEATIKTDITPYHEYQSKQQRGVITKALDELSEDHRQVVVMREVEGFSYSEIAQTLNTSIGTIMSRLFYARKKLQELLKMHINTTSKDFEDSGALERQRVQLGKVVDA